MNLKNAKAIMNRVRDFYKTGSKSNNKVYSLDTTSELVSDADIQSESDDWVFQDLQPERLEKMLVRHQEMDKPLARFDFSKHWAGTVGKVIWETGDAERGNCMEMAAVSMYLAYKDYGTEAKDLHMGVIQDKGDHAFCLIGNPPAATKVENMSGTSIIIDPWLHVFCYALEYPRLANQQLDKWCQNGKRIAVIRTNKLWWSSTGGEYKTNFGKEPLSFD